MAIKRNAKKSPSSGGAMKHKQSNQRASSAAPAKNRGFAMSDKSKNKSGFKASSSRTAAMGDRKKFGKAQGDELFETVPADFVSVKPYENADSFTKKSSAFDYALHDENDGEISEDFSDANEESAKKDLKTRIQAHNRKGSKSGGFQSMGLSSFLYKAIQHKGYKIPTPIQRKAIPIINDGRDVVAMARTGSGKTAAFLIPMLEKLKTHSAKVGARAIVLSPSRELALQTLKFTKELSKYTDLRSCMLVGGESMEEHFNSLASNPDIIIATPGRLMHLTIEMNLSLKTVEYIVFDEADRLYELGFAEHLREILHKLPEQRQTLLFSATLPKTLVDFARAGLTDPALLRLDMDTKISKDLQMVFLSVKAEEKDAALLYTLDKLIQSEDQQTMIFAPTKHHVDYLFELLKAAGIASTYIYGSLDQSARKIHLARFRAGRVKVMIVTDVAARGIDIPLLDFVINYEFPGAPKVFVHRVGRAARAGRSGTAISFVSTDEMPYLIDLHLFLGRPFVLGTVYENSTVSPDYTSEIICGTVPPGVLGMEMERVKSVTDSSATVVCLLHSNAIKTSFLDSARNGYKLYLKTRPTASKESYVRAKEIVGAYVGMHPMIVNEAGRDEVDRQVLLRSISQFRPAETVFEVGKRGGKSKEASLMVKRRNDLQNAIKATKSETLEMQDEMIKRQIGTVNSRDGQASKDHKGNDVILAEEADIQDAFPKSFKKRKRDVEEGLNILPDNEDYKDSEYYMSHTQKGAAAELGYSMHTKPVTFAEQIKSATMDLNGDDQASMLRGKAGMLWDKKKHKFIRPTVGADNKKMIKTESGALISASYKSERYQDWQKKKRTAMPLAGEPELPDARNYGATSVGGKRYRHNSFTPATLNSKSSVRKSFKRTKEGKEVSNDKSMVKIKRGQKQKLVLHKTTGANAKSELKTGHQIIKKRLKSQRHKP